MRANFQELTFISGHAQDTTTGTNLLKCLLIENFFANLCGFHKRFVEQLWESLNNAGYVWKPQKKTKTGFTMETPTRYYYGGEMAGRESRHTCGTHQAVQHWVLTTRTRAQKKKYEEQNKKGVISLCSVFSILSHTQKSLTVFLIRAKNCSRLFLQLVTLGVWLITFIILALSERKKKKMGSFLVFWDERASELVGLWGEL